MPAEHKEQAREAKKQKLKERVEQTEGEAATTGQLAAEEEAGEWEVAREQERRRRG